MPETPTRTPGQVAYTAYMAVLALSFPLDFAALPDTYHRAWEAAAAAVLAMREEERRRIIHRLCAGAPLCGFSRAVPAEWPAEHRWSAYREDITCPDCEAVQAMQKEEETHG